jgi:CHAD domain-containing protein
MAEGKWIRDLPPELPLSEAARRVLLPRLAVVAEYLPLAKQECGRDPEDVHQLRVATRRADAALRIFRTCLRGKEYRSARQRLRVIRRAAGAARDQDVFLDGLRQRMGDTAASERAGLDFLIGYGLGQRHAAQKELAALEENKARSFAEFVSDTLAGIDWPHHRPEPRLAGLAGTLIPVLLGRLDATAAADLDDYDRLHQVRIAGKRLRYAMEVLVGCFGPSFREVVYPEVETMQEVLGLANDSHVASQCLRRLREELRDHPDTWGRVGKGIEGLLRSHDFRLAEQRRQFLDWWQRWRALPRDEVLPPRS